MLASRPYRYGFGRQALVDVPSKKMTLEILSEVTGETGQAAQEGRSRTDAEVIRTNGA